MSDEPNTPPNSGDAPRPGRKSKLTPELHAAAIRLFRRGNFRETVARRLGVDPATLRHWVAQGRRYPGGRYARFRAEVVKAEAFAEASALKRILAPADDDADHLKWFLERKYPQRWGRYRGETGELKRRVAALEKLLDAATGAHAGETADPPPE